jgi:hypothetical protein
MTVIECIQIVLRSLSLCIVSLPNEKKNILFFLTTNILIQYTPDSLFCVNGSVTDYKTEG